MKKIFIDLTKDCWKVFSIQSKRKDFLLLSACLLNICLFSLEYKSVVCEKCNFVLLYVSVCVCDWKKLFVGNTTLLVINAYFHICSVYVILNQNWFYILNLFNSHFGFQIYWKTSLLSACRLQNSVWQSVHVQEVRKFSPCLPARELQSNSSNKHMEKNI